MTIKLVVNGAAGRMGRQVIGVVTGSSEVVIAGGVVRPDSPIVGVDAGVQAGVRELGVYLTADPDAALSGADVALDVSNAGASVGFAQRAASLGIPTVVATTGLANSQLSALQELSQQVAILIAPNLSVGINVLAEVLPAIVRALGSDYDIEVVEAHHRHKKDAPSGTAIRLAEAIASALDRPLAELERYGRHGLAPRVAGEIGMHSLRMGGNPGEHHIYFASEGEEIEISHRALSRETFARGAVRAVRYLAGKPPGHYAMSDVLR